VKRKFIGRFISSFNSLQSIASAFVSYKIKEINIFDYLEALEAVDMPCVEDILNNHFIEENAALSVIQKED
jgi:predicted Zn-dependent peptidase